MKACLFDSAKMLVISVGRCKMLVNISVGVYK
jgi:hypothetical protein